MVSMAKILERSATQSQPCRKSIYFKNLCKLLKSFRIFLADPLSGCYSFALPLPMDRDRGGEKFEKKFKKPLTNRMELVK